jgi:hypothetical protein
MSKQFKLMILANVVLALLYVFSSYVIWNTINKWGNFAVKTNWSPLYVTPIPAGSIAYYIGSAQPTQLFNIPFLLFWAIFATNICFIIWLYRSKETKQTTSQNIPPPA